jgi:protein-S-isoprenylcysteine O-methyltransferase Ste14
MHGKKDSSSSQRLSMTLIHGGVILLCGWILLGSGQALVFGILGEPAISSPFLSRMIVFACGLIYFLRMCFTTFVLLKRQMPWREVAEVGPFIVVIQLSLAILTLYHKEAFVPLDWLWIGLYLFGSWLNTGSEWRRMIWKRDEANQGKLYTEGLFRYSMHINYLGDSVLFTAFAMLTGSFWALLAPLLMTLGFVFVHIPKLDAYLQERYGKQFDDYARKTKKLVPWIY